MNEYIDKEQFREALIGYTCKFNDDRTIQEPSKLFDYLRGLANLLNKYPTANVREYAKGRWIKPRNEYSFECPFCHECFCKISEWNFNYCPNCGAEMRGVKEECSKN